ncbi:hypothetical protein MTO96_026175 [Rhipicephalus appendiculatus]
MAEVSLTQRRRDANTSDGSAGDSDQDFDPSAEMLVDDYDDEKTLDEEEALESDASDDELNTLQKVAAVDKPVTEAPKKEPVPMLAPKEAPSCAAAPTLAPPVESKVATTTKTPSPITRATPTPPHLPPRREHRTTSTPHLLRSVSHASESSNSDSDEDFTLEEYWKKNSNFNDVNILGPAYARVPHQTIQVGSEYQATIPVGLCKYDDAPAYENEDRLLWDPAKLSDSDVEEYLSTAQEPTANAMGGGNSLPLGSHTRDDEQALYLLLQCGHNIEEALRRRRMNPTIPTKMSLWSEEECRSFESGLRLYGKDFHLIQLHKVRTRSVGELVHFYYLWKKTERHDIFASKVRLEKKKYALHPGTTDYMDRFLDEQENSQQQQQQQSQLQQRDRSTSPSEAKRPRLALPMQLTSQLVGPQENGREASSAATSLTATADPTRENGRDRLWTAPASSSDEDDLPLIATTARPALSKVAVTATATAVAPSGNVVQVLNKMAATSLVSTVSATQPVIGAVRTASPSSSRRVTLWRYAVDRMNIPTEYAD